MRILRSPIETPDFENLLAPTGGGVRPERRLPDPFADAPAVPAPPVEARTDRSGSFPTGPLGPYRPYWRESTFVRAVGLPHARCVAAMRDWGKEGVIELECGELLVPPDLAHHTARCSMEVRLRRSAHWSPATPMELEFVPRSPTFATWLVLYPRRRVHLSRRYFRAGHALLDRVTERLLAHAG